MNFNRRNFLKNLPVLGSFPFIGIQTLRDLRENGMIDAGEEIKRYGNVIEAPEDPAQWNDFRTELHVWRKEAREKLSYTGEAYDDPQFKWSQSNYTCCFLMMYDLEFYDPVRNVYTVDKIIGRGIKDFGGYDSVVLWHAYPRIGVDQRNQFDYYRDMPGGLEGVRRVVKQFQDRGVKIFIDYNPWDTGTRREHKPDIDALVEMITAIDADGIFLDTLKEGGENFREKLNKARPGVVLEGELAAELEILSTHHQSWAQWFGDKYIPGVLRDKWYERRHIQHVIARWNRDRTTELQQAWMNGTGVMIWENVFGQWIAWSDRDKSILRIMLPIQRRYTDIFNGEGWTPLVETKIKGIFASLWEGRGIRIWTLINRHEKEVSGELLEVLHPGGKTTYFDLAAGVPAKLRRTGSRVILEGKLSPRSVGCFISSEKENLGDDFDAFLSAMKQRRKVYTSFTGFPEMLPVMKKTPPAKTGALHPAGNMAGINPVTISQRSEMQGRECGTYYSYPPDNRSVLPGPERIIFSRNVHIPHIAIDVTPVTNKQYYDFLQATGYAPADTTNFLKHWENGRYPAEKNDHPVVFIDMQDARAYAAWAGKRLPLEEEWLFAAEGYDKLKYPWGHSLKDGCCNTGDDTTPVDAFPAGISPFGCLDMCGNTWELTDSEYADAHNRFCVLKGGCYFDAKGSHWYVKGGPLPSAVSTKMLMMYPGLDRCATIGFRCVKDLA